jgi:tetratricopeptide (TPR) repeat protein
LLACGAGFGEIKLVDFEAGKEIARLGIPDQTRLVPAYFSPDGALLYAFGGETGQLHRWDLRLIRSQLAELGLDIDLPLYGEQPERPLSWPLPAVTVHHPELASDAAKLREPLKLNNQAWHLLTGPAAQRDPVQALELAKQVIDIAPDAQEYLNTLGVAQYRNGLYPDAIGTLEKSLKAGQGMFDGFDLFFLAMCHANLGEPAKAKACFDRAVKWTEAQKSLSPQHVEELKAFRAEAEGVLRNVPHQK